jgi:uncharacterized membrane protein
MFGMLVTSLWLAYTPDSFLGKVDAVGYAVCHRIASHSFTVNGKPLPLCARCSGMYLGALWGIIYQFINGKRRGGFSRNTLIILCSMAVFFVVDGINSFLALILKHAPIYEPQNWLRLVTGLIVGLLISAVLYPIYIQTVWQTWKSESVLNDRKVIVGLLIGSILILAAMLSGLAVLLYPLAILSGLSVLVVLNLVYSILLLMLFKHENRYNQFKELIPVLVFGLVLTMIQIGSFDLLRYLLTGTWTGLPL